jgi:hypothetical protein
MSVISQTHPLIPYTGEQKPLSGQVLIKCKYKESTSKGVKKPARFPNVCVSLPALVLGHEEAAKLLPYLQDWIEGQRTDLVKSLYESGAKVIQTEQADFQALIAWLEENASVTSGRFTKEAAKAWCETSGYSDAVRMRILEVMGLLQEGSVISKVQEAQIEGTVAGYVDKISALTGTKTVYAPDICQKLLRTFELEGAPSDSIAARFVKRLEELRDNPARAEQLLDL